MVLVFFKTVFLVIVIGVFHALVLLPIVLHDTAPFTDRLNAYLDKKDEAQRQKKEIKKQQKEFRRQQRQISRPPPPRRIK
uniref:Uncharacterized protein n=1 Tax=Panagrolaimus sp. PS1159 TaxID=55785 RepID=A0AC35FED3_9BILA